MHSFLKHQLKEVTSFQTLGDSDKHQRVISVFAADPTTHDKLGVTTNSTGVNTYTHMQIKLQHPVKKLFSSGSASNFLSLTKYRIQWEPQKRQDNNKLHKTTSSVQWVLLTQHPPFSVRNKTIYHSLSLPQTERFAQGQITVQGIVKT